MVVGVADRPGQLIRAAGMMFLSPEGRVLLLRNASTGEWVFPGGAVQNGEDPAIVAIRETHAETGYWAGHSGSFHIRRISDGVDLTVFRYDCDSEFVPKLNAAENSAYAWLSPTEALDEPDDDAG